MEQINNELDALNLDRTAVKTYVKEKYLDAFLFVEQKKDEEKFFAFYKIYVISIYKLSFSISLK